MEQLEDFCGTKQARKAEKSQRSHSDSTDEVRKRLAECRRHCRLAEGAGLVSTRGRCLRIHAQ